MRTPGWLVVGLAAACGAAPSAPDGEEPLTVVRLRSGPVSFSYDSGLADPQQVVIRDQNAWQAMWAAIWRTHVPPPPLPEVDFARDMIVVAALGTRPTGGYSVFIDGATAGANAVAIQVRSVSPGDGCAVTLAVTQPLDVARLPRREGTVVFNQKNETHDCR